MSAVCRSSFVFTVACMCACVHVCSERYAEQLPEICLEGVSSPTQPTPSTSSLFGGLLGRRQAQLNRTELCESSTGVSGSHCRTIPITNLIVCPSVCLSVCYYFSWQWQRLDFLCRTNSIGSCVCSYEAGPRCPRWTDRSGSADPAGKQRQCVTQGRAADQPGPAPSFHH